MFWKKRNLIFIVVALFSLADSKGQANPSHCALLNLIIHNKKTQKIFHLTLYPNLPIIFVDTSRQFSPCNLKKFNHRDIKFSTDTSFLRKTGREYICLYNLLEMPDGFAIEIGYKATGAYGGIRFIKKKKRLEISKISIGYF